MPFLETASFREWEDDGNWEPVNAAGFRKVGWGLFSMLTGSGSSFKKYVLVASRGPPHTVVAESDDEGDFLQCLEKLSFTKLTAEDIMRSGSLQFTEALELLVNKGKDLEGIGSGQDTAHSALPLSPEILQKLSRLEASLEAKESTVRRCHEDLASKEAEIQRLREDLASRHAQLQAFQDQLRAGAEEAAQEALRLAAPGTPSRVVVPADMSTDGTDHDLQEPPANSLASSDECEPTARSEAPWNVPNIALRAPLLRPSCPASLEECSEAPSPAWPDGEAGGLSLAEKLLAGGSFKGSQLEGYWRLARAPYNAVRQNLGQTLVEEAGFLWEVVADRRATNTRVVGRDVSPGVVELGFRGTVFADSTGVGNYANLSADLDTKAVALSPQLAPGSDSKAVLVHKGFQQAYLTVKADVVQWLESRRPPPSEIHLSGHSLGATLATLAAVHLCALRWPVAAVVTFGSPPLGSEELGQCYADMGLDRVTVRFANRADPIPRLKELVGSFCDFQHVVPAVWLGRTMTNLWVPTPYSHSMAGNPESYLSTLHDATEGHIQTGQALTMLRDAEPYLPLVGFVQTGFVGTSASAVSKENSFLTVATEVRQQMQVDVALVRSDLARLAQGMAETARELRSYIIHASEWERALDLEAMVDLVVQHPDMLPTWQDGKMPEWFMRLHAAKRKVYEACIAGLRDQSCRIFRSFLGLFLRAGLVLLKAMEACGAPRENHRKELRRFRLESEHLTGSLDWQELLQDEATSPLEICSLLEAAALEGTGKIPFAIGLCGELRQAVQPYDGVVKLAAQPTTLEPFALEVNILKKQEDVDDSQLCQMSVKQGCLETALLVQLFELMQLTDETMQAVAEQLPQSLTSLGLDFANSMKLTDASLKELVARLPQSLTSLSLNFSQNELFTDASLKELAGRLPQCLTSLSLNFSENELFTDASLKELAGQLPQSLTSFSLNFSENELFTDASVKELAGRLPQNLTSLSLNFSENELFTDASLKELAGKLPQSLTSLSLDFCQNELFTDASLRELAGRLPQSLTSLSLHFNWNRHFTDASLKELAGRLPQSLTSLSLDFCQNELFTDASLKELAGRLPQSLTSLSLDFCQNELFTDASLRELAGRLPQSLTFLSLDFHLNWHFTDASLKKLAGRLPQSLTFLRLDFHLIWHFTDASLKELAGRLPQSLTSLSLNCNWNRHFTDASLLKELAGRLRQSLTSLSLDFHPHRHFTDASLRELAGRLPQSLTSLSLNFFESELFTDASLKELAGQLPQSLTSLSLDFCQNELFTDASLRELAGRLPQSLTSLSLHFNWNRHFTDASLKELAGRLPQSLTSLSLDFCQNELFTDASLKELAGRLPQSLTNLSLDFCQNKLFTDASLRELAGRLPQSLTFLSLDFHLNWHFTDASLKELAGRLPQSLTFLSLDFRHFTDASLKELAGRLPQSLTSLSLNCNWNRHFTDASLLKELAGRLRQSLTSLSLDFHPHRHFTDASLKELAGRLPQSLTSLSLNFFESELFTDASLKELAGRLPQSLTFLSLDFHLNLHFTDASLKELAGRLPQSLTSLSLNFSENELFTDASLKELAGRLPQNLTSLSLNFSENELFTDASLKELAGQLPQSLTSLSLDFCQNELFTDASLKELAGRLPQSLTSLSLDFCQNELFTDASLKELAGRLPQSLTSLSLDFCQNELFTDASLRELAGRLPQCLTSLSLHFNWNRHFTDASLKELAGRLPQSLTSLSLHFNWNRHFTDASLKELAGRLPQSLTSLSLDFCQNKLFTDASLRELAGRLPQSLTFLSLDFHLNWHFTDASLKELAGRLPQSLTFLSLDFRHFTDASLKELAGRLPQSLTSLSLNCNWNRHFTDASLLKELAGRLRQSLTSLSLDFHPHRHFTDASLKELAGRLPQSLTSLSLNFFESELFTDASLKELAGRLPQSLTFLSLDFHLNLHFTDASLKELAGRLPQSLTSLSLNFSENELFTDASLKELAGRLPQNLTSLSLNFSENELFTDASLKELAGQLPQSLTSLSLDFCQNELFTDASLKELAGRLPQSLTSLSLDFCQNELFTDASLKELAGGLPQNYQASEPVNSSGLFADIRNRLDADYHGYYTERRQRLQDELLQDVLASGLPDERPWIVYTAGAMGAGKSHVVRWLSRNDYFALPIFVQIDLDRFRTQLPEWLGYVARNSASAGALTHREAGYCAEIAQEAALQRCKHVWVDGSLHDAEWYASEFRRIRKEHPQYRIAIYHVVANWTTVQARVATRATHTGRVVPQDALQKSYHEVPQAVRQLRPFVDFYARIENQEALPRLADLCMKNAQGEIEKPQCSWEVIRAEFAPLHGASQEGALRSWLERLIAEESVLIFAHSQGSGSCQLFLTEVLGIPGVRVLELDQMSSWPFEEAILQAIQAEQAAANSLERPKRRTSTSDASKLRLEIDEILGRSWQVYGASNTWIDMGPEAREAIQEAVLLGRSSCRYRWAGTDYEITLDTRKQTNLQTGTQRDIRLAPADAGQSLPPASDQQDASLGRRPSLRRTTSGQAPSSKTMAELRSLELCCKLDGRKFEDPDFPPVVGGRVTGWRRPQELTHHDGRPLAANEDWQLLRGRPRAEDVRQGELGDCWFLSSLAALAEYQDGRFLRALLPEQSSLSPAGIYMVRLCLGGFWREVIVDDRLPGLGGGQYHQQLAYCSTLRLQLWASIIEKAFAKACGSYEALVGGQPSEALAVLTGWPCMVISFGRKDFDADLMWASLCSSYSAGFLLTCSTGRGEELRSEVGLAPNHAYSLMAVHEVTTSEGQVRLLQIRNPHARCAWKGAWSQRSGNWTPELRSKLRYPADDDAGMFFMAMPDFIIYFDQCTICQIHGTEWCEARVAVPLPSQEVPRSGLALEACGATAQCLVSLAQPEERARGGYFYNHLFEQLASVGLVILNMKTHPPSLVAASGLKNRGVVGTDCWLRPEDEYLLAPSQQKPRSYKGPTS
ncbi:sol [Symbiodinium sp. CCMP2592]|nr:sol [Symbiodinium sp. CCMP2592]